MSQHGDDTPQRAFTGLTCALHPDAPTVKAAFLAISRAKAALDAGRLLSPREALAIAGKVAREKETLFSIARAVAWETNTDQDEVLCRLGEKFPDFA